MILILFSALLLVTAIALGCYAGRSANQKVRRFFWLSLVLGLSASSIALGVAGEWWLALGPALPLFLILLLWLKFPFLFGAKGSSCGDSPEKEQDNEAAKLYNVGHEKTKAGKPGI